jgi:hypothetical protein
MTLLLLALAGSLSENPQVEWSPTHVRPDLFAGAVPPVF